jgi:hypothetical protein
MPVQVITELYLFNHLKKGIKPLYLSFKHQWGIPLRELLTSIIEIITRAHLIYMGKRDRLV